MTRTKIDRRLSVAPMLDWTNRHCRYFLRQITQHTALYTEMVTTGAIIYGKGDYLEFNQHEHPVAVQLGGSDVDDLTRCAVLAQERGYDEINLNVGCPSDRVQRGRFGACLMKEPTLVAECVAAMQSAVDIPVTVKSRIGVDELEGFDFVKQFVEEVANVGCKDFIVHARKAWLKGLSPKQNREIPELDYDCVYQLKQHFPELHISINGGIKTLAEALQHLDHVDGVMIGREAYANPFMLIDADELIYAASPAEKSRQDIALSMIPYIQAHIAQGGTLWHVVRHMIGLFHNQPNGRLWRRYLAENAVNKAAGIDVFLAALDKVNLSKVA